MGKKRNKSLAFMVIGLATLVLLNGCNWAQLKAEMEGTKVKAEINKSGLSKEEIKKARNSIAMELYGVDYDTMQKTALTQNLTTSALGTVSPAFALAQSATKESAIVTLSKAILNVDATLLEKIKKGDFKSK